MTRQKPFMFVLYNKTGEAILTTSVDIDYIKLSKILTELFPHVFLFSIDNLSPDLKSPQRFQDKIKKNETDIYKLIQKNKITEYENKEIIVREMSKSERFGALFPTDISLKERIFDKLKTNNHDEKCNVIASYIEIINEIFIQKFNTVVRKEIRLNDTYSPCVSELFVKKVFPDKTFYYVDQLKDPKILNICEHSPSSIYGAFEYYAHKQYTLIRLGREFPIEDMRNTWKIELEKKRKDNRKSNNYLGLNIYYENFTDTYEKTGEKNNNGSNETDIVFALKIIEELFIYNLKLTERQILKIIKEENTSYEKILPCFKANVREKISLILESTPEKSDSYTPTDFITLTGQISGQLGNTPCSEEYKKYPNEIKFTDLNQKYNEDGDAYDFDPEEDKYHNVDEALRIKESWEIFINDFLKKEFNADDEKDFIGFISKEENWSTLAEEFKSYYIKGIHNKDSSLFNVYSGGKKNISHTVFAQKLRSALKEYIEWYKETNPEEGKNGKRA